MSYYNIVSNNSVNEIFRCQRLNCAFMRGCSQNQFFGKLGNEVVLKYAFYIYYFYWKNRQFSPVVFNFGGIHLFRTCLFSQSINMKVAAQLPV